MVQGNAMQSIPQDSYVQSVPYSGAADFAAPCSAMQLHKDEFAQSGAVDSIVHSGLGTQQAH